MVKIPSDFKVRKALKADHLFRSYIYKDAEILPLSPQNEGKNHAIPFKDLDLAIAEMPGVTVITGSDVVVIGAGITQKTNLSAS